MGRLFEASIQHLETRPPGSGNLMDFGVAPGVVNWNVVAFEPGHFWPNHHTDTIDFGTVLDGSIELILDDGAHELDAGDCVVVSGVDHAWQAGPEGCQVSFVAIGTPPLSR